VATIVDLMPNTVSMLSAFLYENTFIERIGTDVMPTRAVVEFAQAHAWSPEIAPKRLAPLLRKTWFGEILLRRLAFRPLSEDDALTELAGATAASTEFRPNLALLVDYIVIAGLARREGTMLYLGEDGAAPAPTDAPPPRQPDRVPPMAEQREDPPNRTASTVATGFMTTEGAVQFHVSVKVTMAENGYPLH
jgi:hypothetical protein